MAETCVDPSRYKLPSLWRRGERSSQLKPGCSNPDDHEQQKTRADDPRRWPRGSCREDYDGDSEHCKNKHNPVKEAHKTNIPTMIPGNEFRFAMTCRSSIDALSLMHSSTRFSCRELAFRASDRQRFILEVVNAPRPDESPRGNASAPAKQESAQPTGSALLCAYWEHLPCVFTILVEEPTG
jgi:hypothetical protein